MALGALLVKGEERGRFEGKHGEGGHEDIWEHNLHIGRAIIRDVVKTGVHQPKARIGREMLAYFGSHTGPGHPWHDADHNIRVRGYVRIEVYERPVQQIQ